MPCPCKMNLHCLQGSIRRWFYMKTPISQARKRTKPHRIEQRVPARQNNEYLAFKFHGQHIPTRIEFERAVMERTTAGFPAPRQARGQHLASIGGCNQHAVISRTGGWIPHPPGGERQAAAAARWQRRSKETRTR